MILGTAGECSGDDESSSESGKTSFGIGVLEGFAITVELDKSRKGLGGESSRDTCMDTCGVSTIGSTVANVFDAFAAVSFSSNSDNCASRRVKDIAGAEDSFSTTGDPHFSWEWRDL